MVELTNSWIKITKDEDIYFPLFVNFSIKKRAEKHKLKIGKEITIPEKDIPLYQIKENCMYIPIGLQSFIEDQISSVKNIIDSRTDLSSNLRNTKFILENIDDYKDILEGIELRDIQLTAARKVLGLGRCLIQMPTGSGKSEVMCAVSKLLALTNNNILPTVLVLEPTVRLVEDMALRFKKYDIPVVKYSENRKIKNNCINIAHPISLGNDIEKDSELLSEVEVLFGDECHHFQCETMRKPIYNISNLVYSVGISASVIKSDHIGSKNYKDYSLEELLTIGATGPLVMNVKSSSIIGKSLAESVIYILENAANESLEGSRPDDWHAVQKFRLESENRIDLIVNAVKIFFERNRKILILIRTIRNAHKIMSVLDRIGLTDYTRASFGSGRFERYNGFEFIEDNSDVYQKFKSGEYRILIGTSHIYEGADIPNLDALILGYGGKEERLQIQGVGRVLRESKTGKYAHIVDFDDIEDSTLHRHSIARIRRYHEILGVPEERIFLCKDVKQIEEIFDKFEDVKSK